ncbi:DUF567-domain-containing protein [Pleomassaria siparia CBS 279.74]|uniref:DUF567-domain-containing protein n=1 Tax=Pleomassaria siparia CBS 279.74 TaxID=1314801 RepID=A0A6G1JR21_9PLEO|nr:DUF567-domain-containing protein [Pleomassaria siparia CBS 279.74]
MAALPAPQLQGMAAPIGVFSNYIANRSETLILKEKVLSLSGDSFSIKNLEGQVVFQVKGNASSLSGRKAVMDAAGNVLFELRKQHIAIHKTYYAENANKEQVFKVASRFKIIGSKAIGTFTSVSGKAESLIMEGNFFDTTAEIKDESTGRSVARIDRKFLTGREIFAQQQTYVVTVAPGMDMAIVVAMCVALDEMRNEK